MERLLATYGKKWWWSLSTNIINELEVAAWRTYCNVHGNDMDLLSIITLCLLKGAAPSTSPLANRSLTVTETRKNN